MRQVQPFQICSKLSGISRSFFATPDCILCSGGGLWHKSRLTPTKRLCPCQSDPDITTSTTTDCNIQCTVTGVETIGRGLWYLELGFLSFTLSTVLSDMTILGVLALDYLVAVYPLVLIAVTYMYVLVVLYDRYNCGILRRIIGRLCRCTVRGASLAARIHKWDVRSSLIGAFATFLLLSYVKFLSVSADLLNQIEAHKIGINCTTSSQHYLYYNASIEFFGPQHRPYAIAAILVFVVFNALPVVLLCLYPCRCFQRLLSGRRLRCLHTFMDAFQGSYKNGTEDTLDCCYFAAVYLVVRIVLCVMYMCTVSSQMCTTIS